VESAPFFVPSTSSLFISELFTGPLFSDLTRSDPSRYGSDPTRPDCPCTLRHRPKMWPQRQRFVFIPQTFF